MQYISTEGGVGGGVITEGGVRKGERDYYYAGRGGRCL